MTPNAEILRALRLRAAAEGECYTCRCRPVVRGRYCEHCRSRDRDRKNKAAKAAARRDEPTS